MGQLGCGILGLIFFLFFIYAAAAEGNWSLAIIASLFIAVPLYLRFRQARANQQTTTLPQTPETTPEQASPEQDEAHPLNISPESVASADVPDLIRRLAELRDAGAITDEEFERKKAELLDRI